MPHGGSPQPVAPWIMSVVQVTAMLISKPENAKACGRTSAVHAIARIPNT
jgi:hypothetical protein